MRIAVVVFSGRLWGCGHWVAWTGSGVQDGAFTPSLRQTNVVNIRTTAVIHSCKRENHAKKETYIQWNHTG